MSRKNNLPCKLFLPPQLNNPFADLNTEGLPPGKPVVNNTGHKTSPLMRGRVVLRREKAHRGGKTVIVVHDFPTNISYKEIEDLGRRLRNACGCGGTVRERLIELQGDQPARIRAFLEQEGFRVAGVS